MFKGPFRVLARAACSAALAGVCVELGAASLQSAQRGNTTVAIDFRAFTEDGQPVLDLKPDDLLVKIDGRDRSVSALKLVRAARPAGGRALPPPFATNVSTESGHDLILLVDDDSIAPGHEQGIREAVGRLLDTLGSGDRVALFGVRPGGINVPLSSDPARVRAALGSMMGQLGDEELACRTKIALQSIASVLGTRSTNPVTVVFFSSGMAAPDSSIRTVLGGSERRALCEVRPTDFEAVARGAAAAHVSFFPVLVMEASGAMDNSAYAAGVEHLASVVGADTFRLSANPDPVVARITRDISTYYVASIEIEPADRNDATRHFEIRTKRPGVKLQATPQLVIGKPDPSPGAPRDLLRTAAVYRDVPLRLAAYVSRGADEKAGMKVVALFEPVESSTKLNAASIGLYDEKGTLKAQWTAQPAELSKSPVAAAVVIPAGSYRMRLAAVDGNGRAGTTDLDVQAQLKPLGTFRTSALMLGTPQNGAFTPKLQFTSDQAVVGVLEIYGVPKGAAAAVQLEIADAERGAALGTTAAKVVQGPGDDGRTAFGGFPITTLPPGDYVLRAIVTVDGKEAGRAMQTLRKQQP